MNTPFEAIYHIACERHGGAQALAGLLPAVRTPRALARTRDDRWLSQMSRCVFQAGFVWRVVDNKWDGFEDLFFGFPPERIVMLSPEQLDRFATNTRIVRNRQKVLTVQENAHFILDIAREYGSFGRFAGRWPDDDLIGLFKTLKTRGARLGGMTGQRVLRNMGRDTFIVTGDVVRCLQRAGVDIRDNPGSAREMRRIQDTFNAWREQSGLPYAHMSRIAALSV
ncbi:MAG: 3-methyladenine DNA glycosylase [Halioglobus sp.]|nr:3-methyladenine DNA glycosylase [Halioglobus sp.]